MSFMKNGGKRNLSNKKPILCSPKVQMTLQSIQLLKKVSAKKWMMSINRFVRKKMLKTKRKKSIL